MHLGALNETQPLLGPDEPPACSLHNPTGSARSLIVSDHASNRIPRALQDLGLEAATLQTHIAWDPGSAAVARRLSDLLDAPLVIAGYSRLVVDLNRGLSDPTCMPETSDGVAIPGNRNLDRGERDRRIHELFLPYRRTIDEQLHRIRAREIIPALISVHSFTPSIENQRRPWEIGVLWDKDPRIPVPLMDALRNHPADITVGDNEPYSGRHPADYTIDHHAEAQGFPHVSIEVRQDLLTDAEGIDRWASVLFDCLEPILSDDGLYQLWQGH
ncbi:MAG: N-formylglutamate amidohydrolase [Xanthomonadales bacterium]|nr:N-formylglutamate amidohydrolase [Xanthomonadales bacterium]